MVCYKCLSGLPFRVKRLKPPFRVLGLAHVWLRSSLNLNKAEVELANASWRAEGFPMDLGCAPFADFGGACFSATTGI